MKRTIRKNLVYDGGYDAIIYGWAETKQIQDIELCLVFKALKIFHLPGLDNENRTRMLRSRLLSAVLKYYKKKSSQFLTNQ
ncbi:hypothetical protein BpHYR1_049695 [Brachionus plicatilis]|uniref:Uncharacterized protein n=1 Tax=Brachionus plicatilis TaxID=10195 RepID=A0A3M7QVB9_BRAPC|nr:hypothetical protein BpHYR1_049695 [Brachionus plicatilis]